MATITLENAKVARLIPGYGFKAVEEFKLRSGETGTRWFTVWTKEEVTEGDVLTIEGNLSVKLDEYTDKAGDAKQSIAININEAMIMSADPQHAVPDVSDAPF